MKIICIKYEDRHFNPTLDSIPVALNFILQMCQWQNLVTVYEFEENFDPNRIKNFSEILERDEKIEVFSSKVRNIMMKCLNLQSSNSGYRDMKEYY